MRSLCLPWFLVLLLFSSCSKKEEKKEETAVLVTTVVVEPKNIPIDLEFVGICESSHLVEIRSRVQGYIKKVAFKEGQTVREGELLFEIDDREFQAKRAETKAILEKEKAILWSAEKAVERYKPLYEQKAASRRDWEDATAQLLAQQAVVDFNEAKLQEADLNLSYTQIKSPISGYTTDARFQEGTLITPGANDLLTTVSVLDPIRVVVNVADSYFLESYQEVAAGRLKVPENYGYQVTLTLSDGSQYPYEGEVSFISPLLNPATGTLSARGEFPNPDALLKPGQFVRAQVKGAERIDAIAVPQTSVLQGDEGGFVYVIVGDKAVKRNVLLGDWHGDDWIIKSGLQKGDEVIAEGVNKVKEGTAVKVTNRVKKRSSRNG